MSDHLDVLVLKNWSMLRILERFAEPTVSWTFPSEKSVK